MISLTERASAPLRRLPGPLLAMLLGLAAGRAHAQAPSCAWGDGVVLPGSDARGVAITRDASAGVLAISFPFNVGAGGFVGSLRLHHVLEQGVLDPSLPAAGVVFLSGADLSGRVELSALRAIPDAAGGAYVLARACNPNLAHLRCWETAEMRLLHVTASGAVVPGWPALGHALPVRPAFAPLEMGDIVSDGAGGVIAAWVDAAGGGAPAVLAQRFSPDGAFLWPGGAAGLTVLAPQFPRAALRVAGDAAGGATVVVSQFVGALTDQCDLVACKVDAAGALPWGAAGKPVLQQPSYSALVRGVSLDAAGRSFVTALLVPTSAGSNKFFTQLLTTGGARAWGLPGLPLGSSSGAASAQALVGEGFASVHSDAAGVFRFQLQDVAGSTSMGDSPEGVPADWCVPPAPQLPIATPDGHVLAVWSTPGAPAATAVRAIELDETGEIAPGWPASGAVVCGAASGNVLADAFSSVGHLFVAFSADEMTGAVPRVQRLSRATLSAGEWARATRALDLSPPRPHPSRGAWDVSLTLRSAANVTLEAFDVTGRRVLTRELGPLAAGRHEVQVHEGAGLAPGVYRLRARAGVFTAERVLVRVR